MNKITDICFYSYQFSTLLTGLLFIFFSVLFICARSTGGWLDGSVELGYVCPHFWSQLTVNWDNGSYSHMSSFNRLARAGSHSDNRGPRGQHKYGGLRTRTRQLVSQKAKGSIKGEQHYNMWIEEEEIIGTSFAIYQWH